MWQLNAKLICKTCSMDEKNNPTLEDIELKPIDTLTPDMYGGEISEPSEKEYEIWACPKCQYQLWVSLSFKKGNIPQDSTR